MTKNEPPYATEREIAEVEALRQKLLAICDVLESAEDPQVALNRIEEIVANTKPQSE